MTFPLAGITAVEEHRCARIFIRTVLATLNVHGQVLLGEVAQLARLELAVAAVSHERAVARRVANGRVWM